jgi:hypothetical protein
MEKEVTKLVGSKGKYQKALLKNTGMKSIKQMLFLEFEKSP